MAITPGATACDGSRLLVEVMILGVVTCPVCRREFTLSRPMAQATLPVHVPLEVPA